MKAKLSELKLNKVRKILEYEVDGDKKQITIYEHDKHIPLGNAVGNSSCHCRVGIPCIARYCGSRTLLVRPFNRSKLQT